MFTSGYLPDELRDPVLWESGRDLSAGEEEAFRFAAGCYRAEKIALKLVARAEQNSAGLLVKLERRGFDTTTAKAVVSGLESRNLLDDGRYSVLWIRSRLASGRAVSPRWLLVSLGKKGIARESSLKALRQVLDPETEYALLLQYLEKAKPGNRKLPERNSKSFLRSQLKYQGFSADALDRYFDD